MLVITLRLIWLPTALFFRAYAGKEGIPVAVPHLHPSDSGSEEKRPLCHFQPLGPDQICCDDRFPVTPQSPEHDACCLNQDTGRAQTFDSRARYCHTETGQVRDILVHAFSGLLGRFSNASDLDTPTPSLEPPCETPQEQEGRDSWSEWDGSQVRCCGDRSYRVSRQTCCAGVLYNNTAEEMQCCYDKAYERGDPLNPCLGTCGGNQFDRESELCCSKVIHASTSPTEICCGANKMDTKTDICCGDVILPRKHKEFKCCRHVAPFNKKYMQCRRRKGHVSRKVRKQFKASHVCGRLPNWNSNWPHMPLPGKGAKTKMVHVEGRVSFVGNAVKKSLSLTLRPYVLLQSDAKVDYPHINSTCPDSQSLHLDFALGRAVRLHKCRAKNPKKYLQRKVLQVFFPLSAVSCRGGEGGLMVHVPEKSRDFLILLTAK